MFRGKFLIALDVEEALIVLGDRTDITDLWPDAGDTRFEAADAIAGTAVARQLVVPVADETDGKLFAQELRRTDVQMHVDAVLILGVHVFEIVGEAERCRKFMPGLRIEVCIAAAAVDRVVADAEVGEPRWIVSARRQVSRQVRHEIVHARIPSHIELRDQISKTRHGIGALTRYREADGTKRAGQRRIYRSATATVRNQH